MFHSTPFGVNNENFLGGFDMSVFAGAEIYTILRDVSQVQCQAHIPLKTRFVGYPTQMKSTQKNMKCTCPTPAPRVGDPTAPIFHLLALGVGVGGNANFSVLRWGNPNFSVFRYQQVGIANANFSR